MQVQKIDFRIPTFDVEECVNTKCVIINFDQGHGMFI